MKSILETQRSENGGQRPKASLNRLARDSGGNTVIEFAFVGLLFIGLILGVVEVGRVLWTLNALHYGAQQAARCAAVNSTLCGTNALLQSWAAGIGGSTLPGSAFTLTTGATCATGVTGAMVTATYQLKLYIPYLNMNPNLSATSCFPTS
jgi:Flp pilus assembly protein TadG